MATASKALFPKGSTYMPKNASIEELPNPTCDVVLPVIKLIEPNTPFCGDILSPIYYQLGSVLPNAHGLTS